MDIQDGWLTTARRVISPHHDTRPEQVTPPFTGDPQYQSAAGTVRWPVY